VRLQRLRQRGEIAVRLAVGVAPIETQVVSPRIERTDDVARAVKGLGCAFREGRGREQREKADRESRDSAGRRSKSSRSDRNRRGLLKVESNSPRS
jgi:hypothetical protein